ncbi:HECT-like ubiquitin-conjugating enzyme-binding-domain-containing protein [Chiua virens]|nr:HECT-like ubiquitin-conjugating enzyme-binding-domain-containing protein [Chiua virens]
MATLVRTRPLSRVDQHDDLQSSIPSPFPTHRLQELNDDALDELAAEPVDYDDAHTEQASTSAQKTPVSECQNEIQKSVAAVQHSCLMTLTNILSPINLHTDDAEHLSSPNSADIPFDQVLAETPLSCLVHVLRARLGHRDRRDQLPGDATLLSQLYELVDAIAPTLHRRDAHLAQAIVALLLDLEQLPASLALTSAQLSSPSDASQRDENRSEPSSRSPYATIASLQRQLSSLQSSVASTSSRPRPTPMESVQTALLWARIDEQLENVVSLCKARSSSPPQNDMAPISPSRFVARSWDKINPSLEDTLPPEYDSEYHHYPRERPPSYVAEGYLYSSSEEKPTDENDSPEQYPLEKVSPRASTSGAEMTMERGLSNSLDLENITHTIERLYDAAPQLANQRVELRKEKVLQMEQAKEGKGKSRTCADVPDPELDKMLDLLGRASAREIPDQSVVIDPHRRGKGAAEIEEQRRKYLEHLVHRTHVGRLHSQDAVPSLGRTSSPPSTAAQVTDGDSTSEEQRGSRDGKRASYPAAPKSDATLEPPSERRNRSLSAPHLAWLRPKDKSGGAACGEGQRGFFDKDYVFGPQESARLGALDIAYVAEHHETLKHVLLFIAHASPSSATPAGVPMAEVLPSTSSGTYGDCLFLRLAGTPSPPLALPVPVVPGSKTVLSRSGHWEVKASCYHSGVPPKESEEVALLPASELSSLSPSSYTCSSCSLPLVPVPPARYRDLPSEHWEELIDAWMCHPEGQTLTKTGMHGDDGTGKGNNFGFWPTQDEALVGGSYILFNAAAAGGGNIKSVEERGGNTRLARCLCGAILGRQHDRRQEDGTVLRMYRLFKYAIRPISTTSQVPKIPMSAFVLHDMLEHVQAHATYRFVLSDEEDEKPRLLIWLFKPRLRISYMLPASVLLPKSGAVDASKVLYKILGPTTATSDLKDLLNKYPGFPQAEYLFYPMDVCRKLAALLKESTVSYPEGMRTMTGLDPPSRPFSPATVHNGARTSTDSEPSTSASLVNGIPHHDSDDADADQDPDMDPLERLQRQLARERAEKEDLAYPIPQPTCQTDDHAYHAWQQTQARCRTSSPLLHPPLSHLTCSPGQEELDRRELEVQTLTAQTEDLQWDGGDAQGGANGVTCRDGADRTRDGFIEESGFE